MTLQRAQNIHIRFTTHIIKAARRWFYISKHFILEKLCPYYGMDVERNKKKSFPHTYNMFPLFIHKNHGGGTKIARE